jgi:hypothetical protein
MCSLKCAEAARNKSASASLFGELEDVGEEEEGALELTAAAAAEAAAAAAFAEEKDAEEEEEVVAEPPLPAPSAKDCLPVAMTAAS